MSWKLGFWQIEFDTRMDRRKIPSTPFPSPPPHTHKPTPTHRQIKKTKENKTRMGGGDIWGGGQLKGEQ